MKIIHLRLLPSFIFLLCFIGISYGQWQIVPGTASLNIENIELTDDYLFVINKDEQTPMMRIKLGKSNEISYPTKSDGTQFTQKGKQTIKSFKNHIFCYDNGKSYISHNYGNTWDTN